MSRPRIAVHISDMRLSDVTDSEFSEVVASSKSIAEVLRSVGLPSSGGSYSAARRRIKDSSLDDSHFLGQGHSAGKASWNRKPPKEMLILRAERTTRYGRKGVLRAMLESGVPYQCAICGIAEWQGKELLLHIDHIDGNWKDDRIQNLRFLCPNCHSQTDTWGRKRKHTPAPKGRASMAGASNRKVNRCQCGAEIRRQSQQCNPCAHKKLERTRWPSDQALLDAVAANGYSNTGRSLGVSNVAVKKRLQLRSLV